MLVRRDWLAGVVLALLTAVSMSASMMPLAAARAAAGLGMVGSRPAVVGGGGRGRMEREMGSA